MSSANHDSNVGELQQLRKDWIPMLILGIGLAIFGVAAISAPLMATMGIVTLIGILMIVAGAAHVVSAFASAKWSGVFLSIVIGILYAVIGFFILENPLESAVGITLLLGAFFCVSGIFRIVFALRERFPTWGWALLNGAVTLLLGIIIWRQFPESALWLIGLLVGIDFIFTGWSWIMLALAVRSVAKPESSGS
jgi:uncharacterized membrane protein HdeD (DUF308 family)